MIEDGLSRASTLKAAMKEGDIPTKFGMDDIIIGEGEYLATPAYNHIEKDYRFCIQRNNNSYDTFY